MESCKYNSVLARSFYTSQLLDFTFTHITYFTYLHIYLLLPTLSHLIANLMEFVFYEKLNLTFVKSYILYIHVDRFYYLETAVT